MVTIGLKVFYEGTKWNGSHVYNVDVFKSMRKHDAEVFCFPLTPVTGYN